MTKKVVLISSLILVALLVLSAGLYVGLVVLNDDITAESFECVESEKNDFVLKPYEIFDPVHTWKRKVVTNFVAKKLQVKVFEKGRQVYESPTVSEITAYCKEQVDSMWEEVKRFENPHDYYVDLSEDLWNLRQDLLKRGNAQ